MWSREGRKVSVDQRFFAGINVYPPSNRLFANSMELVYFLDGKQLFGVILLSVCFLFVHSFGVTGAVLDRPSIGPRELSCACFRRRNSYHFKKTLHPTAR
jgi:hypothetical protein